VTADERQAALAIASRAADGDDCRLLLAMLGITTSQAKRGHGRPPVDHGHGHGHYITYAKGCRCADCRNAHRIDAAERRARWATTSAGADHAGHGKASTYRNYRCRCTACTAANSRANKDYRARLRQRVALAEIDASNEASRCPQGHTFEDCTCGGATR